MGLNPMILRQAQTFAFLFSPWRAPPAARHPYRASGLVLAQIAVVADGSLPAQCGSLCVISTGAQRTLVLSTWGTAVVRAFRIVADAGPLAARREPPVPAAAHGRAMAEAVHGPPAAVAPDVAAGHERPAALG
jgi:hypothetical protein